MKRNFIMLVAFVSFAGWNSAKGQSIGPSAINCAGGEGTIGGNQFEWSLGEIAYVPTSSLIVTQGVLQPKIKTATVVSTALSNNIRVFPNPSNSIVNIELTASRDGKLDYRLMDVAGRVVMTKTAEVKAGTSIQQFNISHLASASYLLHVSADVAGATEETVYTIQKLQ